MTNEDTFWYYVQLPLSSSKYYATVKTLERFYKASLKKINSPFKIERYSKKSEDYPETITFRDGIYQTDKERLIHWTTPWFGYKMSIASSATPDCDNISSIVENALLLMGLNGMDFTKYLIRSDSSYNLVGYERDNLIHLTRHLLAVSCHFYASHKLVTKDKITIEYFTWLCAMNFFHSIMINENIDFVLNHLVNRVVERNKINFRSKYGKNKDSTCPVTLTVGGKLSRGQKHSISMTKFGSDIEREISCMYPDKTIWEITTILNNKGIPISKSSVGRVARRINIIDRFVEDCQEYLERDNR